MAAEQIKNGLENQEPPELLYPKKGDILSWLETDYPKESNEQHEHYAEFIFTTLRNAYEKNSLNNNQQDFIITPKPLLYSEIVAPDKLKEIQTGVKSRLEIHYDKLWKFIKSRRRNPEIKSKMEASNNLTAIPEMRFIIIITRFSFHDTLNIFPERRISSSKKNHITTAEDRRQQDLIKLREDDKKQTHNMFWDK